MAVISVSWERCELLFEPDAAATSAARHFLVYYLPFDDAPCVTGPASSCTSQYKEGGFYFGRARAFRQRVKPLLERATWRDDVAHAVVVGFQARTHKDAFFPMEVATTTAEATAVVRRRAGRRLLVWPEA